MKRKKSLQAQKPFIHRLLFVIFLLLIVFVGSIFVKNNSSIIYSGTLPCGDCSGIHETIVLKGDHSYMITSEYVGRDITFTQKGYWKDKEKNGKDVLILSADDQITLYEITDEKITLLDSSGNPISSPFNLSLKRQ